jgi:UDP-2,3-diacylglucosamine pyrophosphatase LpxH
MLKNRKCLGLLALSIFIGLVLVPPPAISVAERMVIVISDLHMGLGKAGRKEWHPTEDFRWPNAFQGFLKKVTSKNQNVDLVIAGDFLELWQTRDPRRCQGPKGGCEGPKADYGCTVTEMIAILNQVTQAHIKELKALSDFASSNGNCVYILPGNHDASLAIDEIWDQLAEAMEADQACIRRVKDGIWTDSTGQILVEHGHLIGNDPNGYNDWPKITKEIDGKTYIERPWGEFFVQSIFNKEEMDYPLIDNLSPRSAGLRYRMAERGFSGTTADVGRFLKFNLLETSVRQKGQFLGKEKGVKGQWDLKAGRSLGYELFLGAMDPTDPFSKKLRGGQDEWAELQSELSKLANTLSDEETKALCDQLVFRKYEKRCVSPELGAVTEGIFFSRTHVTGKHVKQRAKKYKKMGTFIYGHTHSFERKWRTQVSSLVTVDVLNSGAFQRLIDDASLIRLAREEQKTPLDYIKSRSFKRLDPCYTYIEVTWKNGMPFEQVRAWYMDEAGPGEPIDPCDPLCPNVGQGC